MQTEINPEFETGPIPCGPHCTRKQARELLEGLYTAYQSLLPAERIVIQDIVAQSARTQFTQEMNTRNRRRSVIAVERSCCSGPLLANFITEVRSLPDVQALSEK